MVAFAANCFPPTADAVFDPFVSESHQAACSEICQGSRGVGKFVVFETCLLSEREQEVGQGWMVVLIKGEMPGMPQSQSGAARDESWKILGRMLATLTAVHTRSVHHDGAVQHASFALASFAE